MSIYIHSFVLMLFGGLCGVLLIYVVRNIKIGVEMAIYGIEQWYKR